MSLGHPIAVVHLFSKHTMQLLGVLDSDTLILITAHSPGALFRSFGFLILIMTGYINHGVRELLVGLRNPEGEETIKAF